MKLNDHIFQNIPMTKTKTQFNDFWNFCKDFYKAKKQPTKHSEIEKLCQEFELKNQKMQAEVLDYREFLKDIPLIIPLKSWLEEQVSVANQGNDLLNYFRALIEKKIIPSSHSATHPWSLQLQQQHGHEKIIENIRCCGDWTIVEREKVVSLYLMFSKYLAAITFGFVPHEEDPDRVKTARRVLPFEVFLDFVSQLPERDALIATILYYGGISVTKVLDLKVSQVDFASNSINFIKETIFYPHHVMQRLQTFMQGKKPAMLVFTSRTGEDVNRSRLFTSFKNASAKMSSPREISPIALIESRTHI